MPETELMKTVYACVHAMKMAAVDHFETGCETAGTYVMSDAVNITAETLPKLVKTIGDRYGLEIDYAFLNPGRFSFNRLENAEGFPPSDSERKQWEQGKLTLYLADYDFSIEKRTICDVPSAEFDTLGIQIEHFE
jgi:hypothetical protein